MTLARQPKQYLGVRALNPPEVVLAQRAPTAADKSYIFGTLWINELTQIMYAYVGAGAWTILGGAGGAVATINTLPPTAGNITIAGTASQIAVANAGSTVTLSIPAVASNTTSFTSGSFITSSATVGTTFTANSIAPTGSDTNIPLLLNTKGTGSIVFSRSAAGVDLNMQITNSDNTAAAGSAGLQLAVGGSTSTGDPYVSFQISGVAASTMTMGLDNSASDLFVISNSTALGTSNALTLSQAGALSATTTITAGSDITSTTGNITATAGSVNAGTTVIAAGDITSTGGTVIGLEGNFSGMNVSFKESPLLQTAATTGDVPTGATGDVNLMAIENGVIMEQFILGAGQTIIAPRMSSTGLLTSLDLTNAEGAEYNFGAARSNSKFAFTANVSAAFFIELTVNAADIGGLDPFVVGFRKVQANDSTFGSYTDFACIGANATTAADVCVIQTQLNTGGVVITNTTDAWTDGTTKIFKVLVSSTGDVTYTIDGLAPTVTAAFTFDAGDVVVPFIRHTFGAATPAAINWTKLRIGFQ